MQERQFLKYDYRTNVADLKTMAKELREFGWVKEDYSDRVDKYIDSRFWPRRPDVSGSAFDMVSLMEATRLALSQKKSRAALLSPQAGEVAQIYRIWFGRSTPRSSTARVPNTAGRC